MRKYHLFKHTSLEIKQLNYKMCIRYIIFVILIMELEMSLYFKFQLNEKKILFRNI